MSGYDDNIKKRYKIIEPFLKKEKKLKEIESETGISYATLKRWVKSFKDKGIKGLSKKERVDKNSFKVENNDIDVINQIYKENVNLSVAQIYNIYKDKFGNIISYNTFNRIINNLDGFVKKSTKYHLNKLKVANQSYGIFQYPIYFPLLENKRVLYLTIYFDTTDLRVANYMISEEELPLNKLYLFIYESIKLEKKYPSEIIVTNTIPGRGKTLMRTCYYETSIELLEDDDFEIKELKKLYSYLEDDLILNFKDMGIISDAQFREFVSAYLYLGEDEERKDEINDYESFHRLIDFFLNKANRKVYNYGIRLKNKIYHDVKLDDYIEQIVEIRFNPNDNSYINIYFDDEFLTEAKCIK